MLTRMISNPFYCLPEVAMIFAEEHECLISEEKWIDANVNLIKEIGAKEFLKNLLENLKGNFERSPEFPGSVEGYKPHEQK